jgi:hypothetical protein
LFGEVSMKLDARELHRRITKAIGAGRLATIFRISEKMIYAWSGRSPEIRGEPPIEKFRMIIRELAAVGETDLAGLTIAYATQDLAAIAIVRIYAEEIHTKTKSERR